MNCSVILRAGMVLALLGIAAACSDDEDTNSNSTGGATSSGGAKQSGGSTSAAGAGGKSSAAGGSSAVVAGAGGSAAAGAGGAGATSNAGSAGTAGAAGSTALPTSNFAYFVKQAVDTSSVITKGSMADGVITVEGTYPPSGNAFKYVAPNYYGTSSNGFISLPTPLTGDFSISAEVTITAQNKPNNACGVGLGVTTGFNPTDMYAYILMRNSNNATSGYFVNGAGTVSAGLPNVPFTNGTPLQLTFTRTGSDVIISAGAVGETPTSRTIAANLLTDGTTIYGTGAVYPTISFNNVAASIKNLVIKDATGASLFDSSTGSLVNYVPAALTISSPAVSMKKGASTTVTATANAIGGDVSSVTAVAADPTIVNVSVTNGATNSTVNLTGLKGGVTTLTITNTSDASTVTQSKTVTVSVNDYPTADAYGSLAALAYPAPDASAAYPDGDFALTFDAPPTLNAGGSIKVFRTSDGKEMDSISFEGETQTFGATSIKVGKQLVRVVGNTVYFSAHLGKLAYGGGYYIGIPTTSITGTLNGVAFNGLSDLNTVATWKFTTRATPTLDAANVTVDGSQTSTANFRSLARALDFIALNLTGSTEVTINVAAGTYNELLRYSGPGLTQRVRIVGPAGNNKGDTCVFQWENGNNWNGSTQTRATFYFTGANLVLENITLKNMGVRSVVSQAETLYFAGGGTLAAYNSSFFSNQDTIQTSGRNWFYKCHIEGNVDFIWGTAESALFENCDLKVINDLAGAAASYSIVVARTGQTIAAGANGTVGKGYVLLNSTVDIGANVTAYFGRNAGAGAYYDQVAFVNVAFTGAGTIGAGMWETKTAPTALGDASYVGWKSAGSSGLNVATLTTATGTSATIAEQATEYDTRDHILNRVVTVTAGAPSGYQAAATAWDISPLVTAWGAP